MITTRNRAVDLQSTCRVLRQLDPAPLEILITADGCTDETVAMVKAELPNAKMIVNARGKGSVASRDRMMREARGDLVLALDDDSYPEQVDCIAEIVRLFEDRPLLAVLHFPQRTDEYRRNTGANRLWLGTFDTFVCQFRSGSAPVNLSPTARL